MLEDAQKTIFEMIVKSPEITGSVNFLKNGKISVQFTKDPRQRIHFNSLLDILELIEVYESKN